MVTSVRLALAVVALTAGLGSAAEAAVADSTEIALSPPRRVRLDLTPESTRGPIAGHQPPIDIDQDRMSARAWQGENRFSTWGRYNRVEGPAAHASLRRDLDRKSFVPAYEARLGYAFAAKRGQYGLSFEQPVITRNKLTLGGEAYRSFLPFFYQDETLGSEENSASAFFLHRDYWDWYEAEGLRAFVGVHPSPQVGLQFGIRTQDEATLVNHADWSVFRQRADFAINPPIPEGTYRAFDASATLDTRPRNEEGELRERSSWSGLEHWVRLDWERANAGLGGDSDLWRVSADIRTYLRLSSRQVVATRILAGAGDGRDGYLPIHRRFALGGLGTLRGHDYRSLSGDRVALANVEYGFSLGGQGLALVFLDSGVAWDSGSLVDQRIPVDAGAGFRTGEDGITALVARTVNRSGADPRFIFRLQESF